MSLDAMKWALKALERGETQLRYEAITALRAAIEQAETQEPVAWRYNGNLHEFDPSDWATGPVTPLYTTPQPAVPERKPWVGLTRDERMDIINRLAGQDWVYAVDAIEARLKENNT